VRFGLKRQFVGLASLSVAASVLASPALSIPVSSPQGFVGYLNTHKNGWKDGFKMKFKWLSGCFKKYGSSGRVKAYVCTNGVVIRTSPRGEKTSCQVNSVKVNKKGKMKLSYSNCKYQ
tara:strand:+ start:121 stop:474 length:354 start_codon:yes stop_codon:yes gene_type:complete